MRNPIEKLAIFLLLAISLFVAYSLTPVSAAAPGFSVSANPDILQATIGTSGYTQIGVAGLNGFTGSVTVSSSFTAGPQGNSPGLNPAVDTLQFPTGDGLPASYTLYITTTSSTTQGIYTLTVTGVASATSNAPGSTDSTTVTVVVNPPLPPPPPAIIGGTLVPVNKLLLASPFIALAGIVGIALSFVYYRRKEES